MELDLPNEADRKMWSVDITPEMKESVMEGQVMFSIGVDKEEQAKYESMSSKDIDEYAAGKDKANNTDLTGFVDLLRNKDKYKGQRKYFVVGKTGELLNKYGKTGEISASSGVFSKRHTANEHKMSENLWIYVIDKINEPVAISRYKERENSYRLYVPVELNGKNVCVGVDVNTIGKNIEITNIKTAFARDIEDIQNSGTEKLLYPTAEEITMAIEQFSAAHNSLRYAQQPLSTDGKGTTNSPTDQINSQKKLQNSNIVDNQGDIEEDIRYSTTDSQESSDALQSAIEIEDEEMPEYRDADHLGESMMQYFERYSKWRDKMMADNMNPDGTPKLNIPVAPICFGYPISQQNQ